MKVVRKGGTEKLKATLAEVSSKQIRVGFFPEATYPDGTPVAYAAAIQEFGYPQGNIPARPFMRPTQENKKTDWGRQIAGAIRGAIDGKVEIGAAFEALGARSAGDIGRAISQVTSPPLSPNTLKARQAKKKTPGVSSKPLVDTGLLIQSVSHVVEEKS
ncbi:Phage-related protein [plant metagenome]|uniref:Phage-related protein n=1 Tax=plant metagenome TaxID=1297885 RepID=A0A484QLM8_9ZZZZ